MKFVRVTLSYHSLKWKHCRYWYRNRKKSRLVGIDIDIENETCYSIVSVSFLRAKSWYRHALAVTILNTSQFLKPPDFTEERRVMRWNPKNSGRVCTAVRRIGGSMFYPSGTTLFDLFHDFGSKWARKRGRAIENGKGEFTNQALHKQKSELFDQTIEGPLLQSRISFDPVQNNNEIFFIATDFFYSRVCQKRGPL